MAIGRRYSWRTIWLVIMVSFISIPSLSDQSDTILPDHPIYSYQKITSKRGVFELGFFTPGDSGRFYVGIWYKSIPSVTEVWVANRDTPIVPARNDVTLVDYAYLFLTSEGDLQIRYKSKIIWSTNTTTTDLKTTKAVLLDDGNLIVGSDSSPNLWESFNYPTDSWLPGAKIGLDTTTGKIKPIILTSWIKPDDPGSGNYSFRINPSGASEFLIYNATNEWRIGDSDYSDINLKYKLNIHFNVDNRTNAVTYATYSSTSNDPIHVRMMLTYDGQLHLFMWMERKEIWLLYWSQPKDVCESDAFCGKYGICSVNRSPPCNCSPSFVPLNPSDWNMYDFSEGCVRKDLECHGDKDSFITLDNIEPPQHPQNFPVGTAEDCQFKCSANCNCSAYSYTGDCLLWFGDLLGMSQLSNTSGGENLHLRVGSTELPKQGAEKGLRIILPLSISLPILVLGSLSCYLYRKNLKKAAKDTGEDLLSFDLDMTKKGSTSQAHSESSLKRGNEDLELPMFSLASVSSATDYFALTSKLGEGGFGPVYRGKLHNGQEVAVKRLSKHSGQGLEELINEAKLIAKLQHTNLVRLLGCCIQQDEKILIYEYMPNKSLDFFLFDQTEKEMLDWSIRMHIIEGIAQGLLYLHHYSRLKIIHRDLKASNILLDEDMTPKISDFGMARIFGKNELQANTRHIVGTFGYMPPEYALEGLFSVKTDVFSFGILLLEILSGQRNTNFRHEDCYNLLGYAWKLWKNDTPFELIDPILKASCNPSTALRYVHVGLLCVQEDPDDRPSILDVVAMIGNEMKVIEVQPKQPADLVRRRAVEVDPESSSSNALTFSTMQPR